MIDLSRTQDEEVGDGTTSVIILSGEMMRVAGPLLQRKMHSRAIVRAFIKALDIAIEVLDKQAIDLDLSDKDKVMELVQSCIGMWFKFNFLY